jgi:uncharacterized RDD family membrane protein YckC
MTVIAPSAPVERAQTMYAGFWIRVLAFLIDSVAIGILVGILTAGQPLPQAGPNWLYEYRWNSFLDTFIGFAYFTVCWSSLAGGQTLGMRLLKLRVVGTDGRPISFGRAALRWLGMVISAVVVLLGLLWVAFDSRKQGWHDKIANTYVLMPMPRPFEAAPPSTPPLGGTPS